MAATPPRGLPGRGYQLVMSLEARWPVVPADIEGHGQGLAPCIVHEADAPLRFEPGEDAVNRVAEHLCLPPRRAGVVASCHGIVDPNQQPADDSDVEDPDKHASRPQYPNGSLSQ